MDDLQLRNDQNQTLAPVQLYLIGPQEVELAAPLLTKEAAALIRSDQAFGIAIVDEGRARGALCARLSPDNDICLELLSLYVVPQYRRRQLGSTLLAELFDLCGEIFDGTVSRIEASFLPEEGLTALLQRTGFQLEADESGICSIFVPVSELTDSTLMKQYADYKGGGTLLPFRELSNTHIRRFFRELENAGADYMDPDQLDRVLPDASFVLMDAESHPVACAIITGEDDHLCLSQFFAAGGNVTGAVAVLYAAARTLLEQCPDAVLEQPLLTPASVRFTKRLLGDIGTTETLMHAILEL